jgi:hypothetical protein
MDSWMHMRRIVQAAILARLFVLGGMAFADSFPWRPSAEDGRHLVEDGTWSGKALNERAWAAFGEDEAPWSPVTSRRDNLLISLAAEAFFQGSFFINQTAYTSWPPPALQCYEDLILWTGTGLFVAALGYMPDWGDETNMMPWLAENWRDQYIVWDGIKAAIQLLRYTKNDTVYIGRMGGRFLWGWTEGENSQWSVICQNLDDCISGSIGDLQEIGAGAIGFSIAGELKSGWRGTNETDHPIPQESPEWSWASQSITGAYEWAYALSWHTSAPINNAKFIVYKYITPSEMSIDVSTLTNGQQVCGYVYYNPTNDICTNVYWSTIATATETIGDDYYLRSGYSHGANPDGRCFACEEYTIMRGPFYCEEWHEGNYCGYYYIPATCMYYELSVAPMYSWIVDWQDGFHYK